MNVVWLPGGLEDVERVCALAKHLSEAYAERIADRVTQAAHRLESFPYSGRLVHEWPELGVREVIVERYRLLYQIIGDTVEIMGLHPAGIPLPDPSED